MKMDEMNEYLEDRGFDVVRTYDGLNREYVFTAEKDGIGIIARFKYTGPGSQRDFLNQTIREWEDARDHNRRRYIKNDLDMTHHMINYCMTNTDKAVYLQGAWKCLPAIEDVIFNGPATIVKWSDGTKTIVKCCEDDLFDPEKGLAMAISKKALGDLKEVKKWTKKYEKPDISFVFEHTATTTAEAVENLKRAAKHMINEVFGR